MLPNQPTQDSTPLLEEAVTCAQQNPGQYTEITVDPGDYYFLHPTGTYRQHTAYLPITGVHHLVFDFQNANLIFRQAAYVGFYVQDCDACVIEHLTLDASDLPFTQLKVVSVDATSNHITVTREPRIGGGRYRSPELLFADQCIVVACYDAKKQRYTQIAYGFDLRGGRPQYAWGRWDVVEPIVKPGSLYLTGEITTIKPGDIFELEMRSGGPAVFVEGGVGTKLKDVSIYASGGPAVIAESVSLFEALRVKVEPRPGTNRLVSTNAGGIQLNAVGPGNAVINSKIMRAQDDSIASNADAVGTVAPMVFNQPPNVVYLTNPPTAIKPGQRVYLIDTVTALPIASSQGGNVFVVSAVDKAAQEVVFTEDLPAQAQIYGVLLVPVNPILRGAGLVIANNVVTDSLFARGIALSGLTDALVLRNRISSTQQAGILMNGNGSSYGPIRDILVSGNSVRSSNMGFAGIGPAMLGAIEATSFNFEGEVIATMPGSGIRIEGNIITKTPRSGIWVESVDSGKVVHNDILAASTNPALGPDPHLPTGLSIKQAVEDFHSPILPLNSNVTLRGNVVVGARNSP